MLLVYIKRSLASLVTDVEVDQVGTGMLGYMVSGRGWAGLGLVESIGQSMLTRVVHFLI